MKQNSKKKKKGNAVLQKYMCAVDEFVKNISDHEEADRDQRLRSVKTKSRKELRKEKRRLKKAKMKSHYEGKKSVSFASDVGEKLEVRSENKHQTQKKTTDQIKREVTKTLSNKHAEVPKEKTESSGSKSSSKKGKKMNKIQESRKMALLEANEQEDREIKKLERCLGINKRKNKKSLPQSFVTDGLDYILGVLDSGSSGAGIYDDEFDEDEDMDTARENFEKLDQDDSPLSDEDEEAEDDMASEESDDAEEEEMGSEEDEEEEMGDENDMNESGADAASGAESEEEASHPDQRSEIVSLDFNSHNFVACFVISYCVMFLSFKAL